MAKLRPVDFRVLREMIGPRDALRLLNWSPTWTRGDLARGPCPVHGSTRPNSRSFVVFVETVYCHKCHFMGDAVALWAKLRCLEMLPAAYDLCEQLRIKPPLINNSRIY